MEEPFRSLLKEIREQEAVISAARSRIVDLTRKLEKALVETLPPERRPDLRDVSLGYWECEGSAANVCLYDSKADRAHDFCLFCEGPEERK